jgi:hypothetical protein
MNIASSPMPSAHAQERSPRIARMATFPGCGAEPVVGEDFVGAGVQRCEQGGGAVAFVVVGPRARLRHRRADVAF